MEFVFGNSGRGYGLLYKNSTRDEQMSKYMQDVNNFGISPGERMYTYKTISDGTSFDVIFSKYSYDDRFERGSIYNHVRWDEYKRNDFLKPRFLNLITSGFASQKDINLLRETGKLNVANLNLFSGNMPIVAGVPLNTDMTMTMTMNVGAPMSINMLKRILYALHMAIKGKVVAALDLSTSQQLDSTDGAIRRCVREIFLRLPVSLRATTSYITSCPLGLFRDSGFRLCVLPLSYLKKQGTYGRDITVIRADEAKYSETGELSEYIEWIVNIDQVERDAFFKGYEENVGDAETIAGGRLLEYREEYMAAKTRKPDTKQSSHSIYADTKQSSHSVDVNKPPVKSKIETIVSNYRSLPGASKSQHSRTHEVEPSAPPQPNYGRMRFSEASYEGWFLNSRMHGWGVLAYDNRNTYVGEFYEGIIKGWGAMLHPNADWRAGSWEQNVFIRGVCCVDGKVFNSLINEYRYGHIYGYGHGYGYGHVYGYGHGYGHGKSSLNKMGPHTQYDLDIDKPDVGMAYFDNGDWFIGEWLNIQANPFSKPIRSFNGWGAYFCRGEGHLKYGRWEKNNLVEQKGILNIRCIDR